MNKLTLGILSGILLLGSVACSNPEKTSSNAPGSTAETGESMAKPTAENNQSDATNEIRKKQLNSDIRSREERNNALNNGGKDRTDADIKSEVRSKLEANLPASQLAIDAKDGNVEVSGTVVAQDQLSKIEPLAKEIGGVRSVVVKATVNSAAKPKS